MLSIVAIFKDEAPYLAEWILFHRLQGFDNFLLYDNDSTDGGSEIAEGLGCRVINFPGHIKQMEAYTDAPKHLPPREWAAFIDIDEFLWCPEGDTVASQLYRYEKLNAIGVPWLMFGDGGWENPPPGLTIDSFLRRRDEVNWHVKQIVRPAFISSWRDPHHTNLPFVRTDPVIMCNHYWTRSVAECKAKFARGRADLDVMREMDEFYSQRQELNELYDPRIRNRWSFLLHFAFLEASMRY